MEDKGEVRCAEEALAYPGDCAALKSPDIHDGPSCSVDGVHSIVEHLRPELFPFRSGYLLDPYAPMGGDPASCDDSSFRVFGTDAVVLRDVTTGKEQRLERPSGQPIR